MHADDSQVARTAADQPEADAALAARNRLVIGLLMISTFTVILNETLMSVALPRLMHDLDVTANAAQWLTTAFLLTMAVVIPVTGFLLQRLATRTVFLMAMSFFTLGTALCAVSPTLAPLVAGRVVQAVGTAIMMPLLMTTVMALVPAESRGKTMGNISIVISVAPAIGPTLSGFILQYFEWRWMFVMMLPIAIGSLSLGYFRLVNVNELTSRKLDLISVPLSAIGFGGLVYGFSAIGEGHGEGGPLPLWLPIAVGAAVLVLFVWRQLVLGPKERALLDLRTLGVRVFTVSVIMMGLAMMALFGMIMLLPLFVQNVLGYSTLHAGLLMLPGGLLMGISSPIVGRLFDRVGARKLVIPGGVIVSAGLWAMTLLTPGSTMFLVLAAHMLLSIGLAMLFTPLFTSSLGSLPKHLYSHGSAVIGTVQQVSGAAGIAIFVSVMSLRIGRETAAGAEMIPAMAAGLHQAFTLAASISLLLIVAGFFVRRPPDAKGAGGHHGGH
ncbi:MDR family MFS transporter [Oceanicola sp. S124]|uniref:MDR family MFS transporter n=1 Tax=Oceanicola sp. S124 TaxID=1042378 RepID=UPI0002559CC9|nr:MDR family MFS transporter [Oceanicola sp. S124]